MQTMITIDSPWYLDFDTLQPPVDWKGVFGNDNPLALEIGCGIGDFIAARASEHPGTNFIAVDYYNKGCWKTCRRLERVGLTNVRVLRAEARELIVKAIPPASLREVYINCPDPWPKKRHRKRRLVSLPFVRFLLPYMEEDARLYFATDFDDYAFDVAEFMAGVEEMENLLEPDRFRYSLAGYPTSKYMQRFLEEGKNIHFVHYRKKAAA